MPAGGSKTVSHPGIVRSVSADTIHVFILSQSACSSCAVKGACSMAEMEDKVIDVPAKNGETFKPGDAVRVTMRLSSGKRAVILGYILPLILLVSVLVLVNWLTADEGIAGLLAILSLFPYYTVLYYTRHRIRRRFTFGIEKE